MFTQQLTELTLPLRLLVDLLYPWLSETVAYNGWYAIFITLRSGTFAFLFSFEKARLTNWGGVL